jgi:hypothetical protein
MDQLLQIEQDRIDAELKVEDTFSKEQTKDYQRGTFLSFFVLFKTSTYT